MGWRFRKSFKLLPGFRLNIGKKGITSATVGKRGLTTSIGKLGIFQNLGIPGTGLSYRSKVDGSRPLAGALIGFGIVAAVIVGVIALCVILAAIGRQERQQEQTTPARLVTNASPVPTPEPPKLTGKKESKNNRTEKPPSGSVTKPSSRYILGPRGGCYYINSSGKKTYVDHGKCR
jgi:hypothetical protein